MQSTNSGEALTHTYKHSTLRPYHNIYLPILRSCSAFNDNNDIDAKKRNETRFGQNMNIVKRHKTIIDCRGIYDVAENWLHRHKSRDQSFDSLLLLLLLSLLLVLVLKLLFATNHDAVT